MDHCVKPRLDLVCDSVVVQEEESEEEESEEEEEDYVESEEDVDTRDMPEEVKSMHRYIYTTYKDEPYFHRCFLMFYDQYPPKYPNYFEKVKRRPGDDQLLVDDAHVPWSRQHTYPNLDRETLVDKLCHHVKFGELSFLWNNVHAQSLASNDQSYYINTIKAAASLLYRLYTKDSLYRIGLKHTLDVQKIKLWDEIEAMLKKDFPVYEACQEIVLLAADNDKYSFLTECDIVDMLCGYHSQLGGGRFHRPFSTGEIFHHPSELEFDQDKIQILQDINEVVMEMELPSTFQVDDYTRMLIRFLRQPEWECEVDLVNDAMKIVDTDSIDGEKTVIRLLKDLSYGVMMSMKWQLTDVVQPLYILSMNILGLRYISHEVLMIVQIAELRRMALGSRFIGRSHLIWAFYECGYGLPKIRKATYPNSQDRDHPPYHIYVAAMKIAKAYCLRKVRLEHFIFAVLFALDSIFDCSEEQWTSLLQDFNDFVEDISLVRTEVEPIFDWRGTKKSYITRDEPKSPEMRVANEGTTTVEPKFESGLICNEISIISGKT